MVAFKIKLYEDIKYVQSDMKKNPRAEQSPSTDYLKNQLRKVHLPA